MTRKPAKYPPVLYIERRLLTERLEEATLNQEPREDIILLVTVEKQVTTWRN